jgi:hypothetical protein
MNCTARVRGLLQPSSDGRDISVPTVTRSITPWVAVEIGLRMDITCVLSQLSLSQRNDRNGDIRFGHPSEGTPDPSESIRGSGAY